MLNGTLLPLVDADSPKPSPGAAADAHAARSIQIVITHQAELEVRVDRQGDVLAALRYSGDDTRSRVTRLEEDGRATAAALDDATNAIKAVVRRVDSMAGSKERPGVECVDDAAPFPSSIPAAEVFIGQEHVLMRLMTLISSCVSEMAGPGSDTAGDPVPGAGGGRGGAAGAAATVAGAGAASAGAGAGAGAGAASAGAGAGGAPTAADLSLPQAISGLGGVGKSATARELCRRLRSLRSFRHGIFWIVGENVGAFQKGYREMATKLGLRFDPAVPNDARDAAFRWMRSHDRWLLVLDNVDEPESVTEFMPPAESRGHTVMTTRAGSDRVRQCRMLRSEPVVLECLTEATSLSLLCQLCGRDVESLSDDECGAARRLCVDELGGLPLAIEQAAAYVRGHGMGFVEYLALYRARWQSLLAAETKMNVEEMSAEWQTWLRVRGVSDAAVDALREYGVTKLSDLHVLSQSQSKLDRAVQSLSRMRRDELWDALSSGDGVPVTEDKSRRSVRTTWELSMRSLSPAHKEMVWLLCNFGADDIPVDAVVACVVALPSTSELRQLVLGTGVAVDGAVPPSPESVSVCIDVLHHLAGLSLVKWEPSSSLASMHRLLQAVVWESAPADERGAVAMACVAGMVKGLSPLVSSVKSSGLACDAATTLRRWLPHADVVQAKRVSVGGPCVEGMAAVVKEIAGGYEVTNQLPRVQQLYRKELAMLQGLHGADANRADVAALLHNLASVSQAQGDLAESVRLHCESLAMLRRLYGVDANHADVAASLNNLANVLYAQGNLAESARLHRESLEMKQRLHGADADHPDVAASLNNLAIVLKACGDLTESAHLHRASLAMKRRLHGADADHPDVAASLNNLANVLEAQGDVAESARLHHESLAMKRRMHADADHPDVAASLNNLAIVLKALGHLAESACLHRESLAMKRRLHGADVDHPDVATSLHNLAVVLETQGDVAESGRLFCESLAMKQRLGT
jgi:tetratricopeptide (TPR) repeat protein